MVVFLGAPIQASDREIPTYSLEITDSISLSEFDMISKIVMAEAENQDWEVQYIVAQVVLNRLENDLFPNTIKGVIFQPYQFSPIKNGRYDKVEPNDSVMEAVQAAIEVRELPEDVLYFTSNGYLKGTEPYKKVGDMYFSK